MAIVIKVGPTIQSEKNKLNWETTCYAFYENGTPVIEPKTGNQAVFVIPGNDLTREKLEERMGVEKAALETRLELVGVRDSVKPALDALNGQVITPKPYEVPEPPSAAEAAFEVAFQKHQRQHILLELGYITADDAEYVAARDAGYAAYAALKGKR